MNLRKTWLLLLLISSTSPLALSQVKFEKKIEGDQYVINAINTSYAPLVIKLNLDSLGIQARKLIKNPGDTVTVVSIPKGEWTEETDIGPWVKAVMNFGDPNAKADNFEYQLPYEKGIGYECLQGFKGKFSHRSIASKYAVDFKMPVGSPIHAARSGVVIYTKEDSDEGGNNREKYINKANKIMILHSDGTIANYVHLMKDGVEVEEGDYVEAGELIGYSGNTGFTTTPHLHFVVRVADRAAKIKFKNIKKLKKGSYYTF